MYFCVSIELILLCMQVMQTLVYSLWCESAALIDSIVCSAKCTVLCVFVMVHASAR